MTADPRRPHVIFVGPDKTGSTWLYERARELPTVSTTRAKDLFFFDRFHRRGLDWYFGQFTGGIGTSARIEIGHDYAFSPDALARIGASIPHATIVLGLREPVDRAVSAYRFLRSQGRTDLPIDRAVLEIPELIDHGRYGTLLRAMHDAFDPTAIRFFVFDELSADPNSALHRLASWCEVPSPPPSAIHQTRSNPARTARHPAAVRMARAVGSAGRALRMGSVAQRAKDSAAVQRLFFAPDDDPPPALRPSVAAALRDVFAPEIATFDALSGMSMAAAWGYPAASASTPPAMRQRKRRSRTTIGSEPS